MSKTDGDQVAEITKRVEAKDADAIYMLANYYNTGAGGLLQDREKAMELWTQATELGSIHAHYQLGKVYNERGDGWTRRRKIPPGTKGGNVREYGTSCEALYDWGICWLSLFHASFDCMLWTWSSQ
jgi:TPR repeat protein